MDPLRQQHFVEVYQKNMWGGEQSRSGKGSDLDNTRQLRRDLMLLVLELKVRWVLDAPCGDCHWIMNLPWRELANYTGVDIVPGMIAENKRRFRHAFDCLDIVTDPLPTADLILCRDALVHMRDEEVLQTLRNFCKSGATWLLTTTFPSRPANGPFRQWRPLNLEQAPFHLPKPEKLLNEGYTGDSGQYTDKSLGLWRLADLFKEKE